MELLSILVLSLSFLTIIGMSAPTAPDTGESSKDADNMTNNKDGSFRELILDSKGFIHLAEDGVARSYDGKGNVIDYHVLNNSQLLGHVNQSPELSKSEALLKKTWADIDGNDVPEHERLNPPEHIKPERFRKSGNDQTPNEPRQVEDHLLGKRVKMPPRCYQMICYDTDACRVVGCYACIQTQVYERERKCVLRPYWYPLSNPLGNCGKKRGEICG